MHEIGARVPIEGDQRHVAQQNGFGLIVECETLRRVLKARGPVNQTVVFRIGPAGVIVAAGAQVQIQKIMRVGVIPRPAGAGNIKLQIAPRDHVDLPFLVHQFAFNAQRFPPHLLHHLGDQPVGFAGVV